MFASFSKSTRQQSPLVVDVIQFHCTHTACATLPNRLLNCGVPRQDTNRHLTGS